VARIGRLAGIPIGNQPLWLAVFGLITWSLGAVGIVSVTDVDRILAAADLLRR
jgi:hypothetical protein